MGLLNLLADSVKEITSSAVNIYESFKKTYQTLESNVEIVKNDFGKIYNSTSTANRFKMVSTLSDDIDRLVNEFNTGIEGLTNHLYFNYESILKGDDFSNGKRNWFWKDRIIKVKEELLNGNITKSQYFSLRNELKNNKYLRTKKASFLNNSLNELDVLINAYC